jgi:protein arginine N-methyltransferase 1
MYSPADYGAMLADEARVRAYLDAIARVVRPGDVVLELGTGPGFFAVAACRAGAAHVYAVEPNEIVRLGPPIAAANGCADRITFLHGESGRVSLPRRADVLIEDMRGVLPVHEGRGAALADAAARLLTPGARRIPLSDTLWAAPCMTPELLRRDRVLGGDTIGEINLAAMGSLLRNSWHKARFGSDDLCGEPMRIVELDYATALPETLSGAASWKMERPSDVTGWCVWFDATLAEGVRYSNSPMAPPLVYAQAFFPLAEPMKLVEGDEIALGLRAVHVASEPMWAWETQVTARGGTERSLRQSTLAGSVVDPAALRAASPTSVPTATMAQAVYASLLSLAEGSRTHEQIAHALSEAHPGVFRTHAEALRFATSRLAAMRGDLSIS